MYITIMSISDIKIELDNIQNNINNINNNSDDTTKDDIAINTSILNKNDLLEKYINNKVINIYARPWNKLENKLKIKKLKEYINNEVKKNNINESEKENIIDKLLKYNTKKILKVEYDIEKCMITKINYKSAKI